MLYARSCACTVCVVPWPAVRAAALASRQMQACGFASVCLAGFIAGQQQDTELRDVWRRANRDAGLAGDARSGTAKLEAWMRFLSAAGAGAAFRGRFLTWLKVGRCHRCMLWTCSARMHGPAVPRLAHFHARQA